VRPLVFSYPPKRPIYYALSGLKFARVLMPCRALPYANIFRAFSAEKKFSYFREAQKNRMATDIPTLHHQTTISVPDGGSTIIKTDLWVNRLSITDLYDNLGHILRYYYNNYGQLSSMCKYPQNSYSLKM